MNVRPDLAGELRKVADDAAVIFPFAPWAWDATIAKLGQPDTPHILLPCPTDIDDPLAPKPNGTGIVSIFHLKSYKRKNLANLARSIRLLEKDGDAPPLSVIGGGETRDIKACEKLVAGIPSIALEGPLGRDEVRARMNAASGFVLPSLRETFGLVFVEALFAGTPIIYPQGTSVDGYFDDTPFAISVDPRDPRSIADAIRYVRANERELKLELANWQSSVGAEFFRRAHIAASFAKGLEQAMASQRQAIARP
jgi:glycosyltransferase involved in cell wall biosynthesis